MENEKLYERSAEKGAEIIEKLQNALNDHPYVGDVRGKGLIIGVELVKDRTTKEPLDVALVNQVVASCKENGVIIGKNGTTVAGFNNVLQLSPPLSIPEEDIEIVLNTLVDAINKLK